MSIENDEIAELEKKHNAWPIIGSETILRLIATLRSERKRCQELEEVVKVVLLYKKICKTCDGQADKCTRCQPLLKKALKKAGCLK